MRGKYEVDNHNYIIKLFNMLTFDEKRLLREYDSFDVIRKIIGMGKEHRYGKEYNESRNKFESLKDHADGNMIHKLFLFEWLLPVQHATFLFESLNFLFYHYIHLY